MSYDASRALDGGLVFTYTQAQKGCSHTLGGEANPWWKAALAKSYVITKVRVHPRVDSSWQNGKYNNVTVSVSKDDKIWTQCASLGSTLNTATGFVDATCQAGTAGKYVKITLQQNGVLAICEVEAHGYELVVGKYSWSNACYNY